MRRQYATGERKAPVVNWTPERIAKRSATVRQNSLGNTRLQNGYRQVMTSEGYRYEHRVVMEEHLNRKLGRNEIVHHINHDKLDNRLENLELVDGHSQHGKMHGDPGFGQRLAPSLRLDPGRWSRDYARCSECATTERKHVGRGLCKNCYARLDRAGRLPNVPDGRRSR